MILEKSFIVNFGSGNFCAYNELIEIINKVLGTEITPEYTKKPKNYVDKAYANISLMRKIFQFNPTPLEKGIKLFIKYLEDL